jgi:hypothetical protein
VLPFSNKSPVLPQPTAGVDRRKVQTERLITNAATGAYANPTTAGFQITTPSVRLVVLFAVTFQPLQSDDTTFPTSGPTAWLLKADAWMRGSREQGGSFMRANNIVTAVPVPWSLNEPAQGIDQIRGLVTVPNSSGSNVVPGTLWVTGIWEPAPGDNIPDDQLQDMLGKCFLNVQGASVSPAGA